MLFEALTGRQAFAGETVSDTIAAVLQRAPDLGLLPAETPTTIRALVDRCLQKNPEERQRDAGDAGIALKEALSEPVASAPQRESRWSPLRVIAVLSLLVAGSLLAWNLKPMPPRPPSMRVALPLAEPLAPGDRGTLVFSRDGTEIVYVTQSDTGRTRLRLRRFDELHSTLIPGTENATQPFLSPDGQSIGFFIEGDLLLFPSVVVYPRWCREARGRPGVAVGALGIARVVAEKDAGSDVAVLSLVTGERKTLARGVSYARYVSTGHVVYAHDGTLFEVRFDVARLETDGVPVPLLDGLSQAAFAVSKFGVLAYVAADINQGTKSLVRVDRDGAVEPLTSSRADYSVPRLSPDGSSVVFPDGAAGNIDLWLYDVTRSAYRRLTFAASMEASPIWTPDGERIVFMVAEPNRNAASLHWMRIDGSTPMERLTSTDYLHVPADVSPDGSLLVFTERASGYGFGHLDSSSGR